MWKRYGNRYSSTYFLVIRFINLGKAYNTLSIWSMFHICSFCIVFSAFLFFVFKIWNVELDSIIKFKVLIFTPFIMNHHLQIYVYVQCMGACNEIFWNSHFILHIIDRYLVWMHYQHTTTLRWFFLLSIATQIWSICVYKFYCQIVAEHNHHVCRILAEHYENRGNLTTQIIIINTIQEKTNIPKSQGVLDLVTNNWFK